MQPEREPISDPHDPLARRIRAAADVDGGGGRGEIIIENEPNIAGARRAGVELVHLLTTPRLASSGIVAELSPAVPTSVVADDLVDQLFQRTRRPQVFALARRPAKARFRAFERTAGDIVVLEGVEGPGNMGSVVRAAVAFDAGGLVLLDQPHSEVYRRGVVRASAGTIFSLPIVTAPTPDFLKFCRASGTRIVTTSSHAPDGSFDEIMASPDRLAIVLGSEARGCSPEIEAAADTRCRIPMSPEVESLNISSAASILLFSRRRARPRS